jgi:diguanylate cyclase (GGDEF)-like protein
VEKDVRREDGSNAELTLLTSLFQRLPVILAVNFAAALGTAILCAAETALEMVLAWFLALTLTLLLRLDHWRRFWQMAPETIDSRLAQQHVVMGSVATGLAWGLAPILFYDPASAILPILLPLVLTCMTGTALMGLTGSTPAFVAFLLGAMGPYALRLGLELDRAHLVMMALVVLASGGMLLIARSVSGSLASSARLQAVNQSLERALEAKSAALEATFEQTAQGLALFDDEGRLTAWNPRHRELHGYPVHLYREGTHLRAFLDRNLAADEGEQATLDPRALGEPLAPARYQQSGANDRTLDVARHLIARGGFICTSTDITEHKQVEARLRHLAQFDALTDLPNRQLFERRLRDALDSQALAVELEEERGCLAVMVLDLDAFRRINRIAGYRIGDQLLRTVARRLRRGLRETDVAARIGGDEFALILFDLPDADTAKRIAAKLMKRIASPVALENSRYRVQAGIGIALALGGRRGERGAAAAGGARPVHRQAAKGRRRGLSRPADRRRRGGARAGAKGGGVARFATGSNPNVNFARSLPRSGSPGPFDRAGEQGPMPLVPARLQMMSAAHRPPDDSGWSGGGMGRIELPGKASDGRRFKPSLTLLR